MAAKNGYKPMINMVDHSLQDGMADQRFGEINIKYEMYKDDKLQVKIHETKTYIYYVTVDEIKGLIKQRQKNK